MAHCGPTVIMVLPRGLLGQIRGAVWKMSFEQCCCLNKDDCLGLSTESEIEVQYVVWVWWNAPHSFTASPIYSAPLYSSAPLQVDLDQASSHHPLLCCVMPRLFSLSVLARAHMLCLFYSIQVSFKDAHFKWYRHLWYPPTMLSLPTIWFSLPSLFSIFPASYLWKWQCYLQSLSLGFADRENGGGAHIRLGHGLWRMIRCACTYMASSAKPHLQSVQRNTLTSQWKWLEGAWSYAWDNTVGLEKHELWSWNKKERQRMTCDGDRRE